MKKLIALLAVCGFAFAFVACGGKKAEEAATEPETEQAAPAEEAAPAEAPADSTAAPADSTAAQ
ncbi:MAG: hypothetical protein MUC73_10425 [Cyclobacteriaceae bacterium]|jgi:hypothetical protein|nr:hypothetical protein [Cyclobacteriaceae bacterium]